MRIKSDCAACEWVEKHGSTKLGTGHVGHTCGTLESPLQRSLRKGRLSTRARSVLLDVVEAAHFQARGREVNLADLTDVELLRRAAKVEPPLSFHALRMKRNCGPVTAAEICAALGLPSETARGRVQCPRCGHTFGGAR
jgi:hypothetical protein